MYTETLATKRIQERGPRYAIYGGIRANEARVEYADTAERAEEVRREFEETWSYHQVRVWPPEGSIDLVQLGRRRDDAERQFHEATAVLRAAVLRAAEQGRAETEIARSAGVDRMTVRSWLGKQRRRGGE